ncbi:hypothetical protein [Streptomyces sp. AP-93]|uniref:hypothetical protein n=1 Tax=Streptomyces sp. AP-93 TaxID=2929048 RepID=UPI001FB0062D|nr:hypothetical protein [Streptomyces sp. AP-93]MCJ0868104.1 hypothetical protein [Streptomyces sp. AP-93]
MSNNLDADARLKIADLIETHIMQTAALAETQAKEIAALDADERHAHTELLALFRTHGQFTYAELLARFLAGADELSAATA